MTEEGGVEAGPGGGGVEVDQHEEERGVEEGEARHGGQCGGPRPAQLFCTRPLLLLLSIPGLISPNDRCRLSLLHKSRVSVANHITQPPIHCARAGESLKSWIIPVLSYESRRRTVQRAVFSVPPILPSASL